jgi:glycosyltransferase involved in cell wall biosynthesis
LAINVRWWNAEAAYALNLARGLKEQGVKVWMIVDPGSPVHHKATTYELPVITDIRLDSVSPLKQLENLKRLRTHIADKKIQLINSFKSNGAFLFSLVRRLVPGLIYIKTRGVASPPKDNYFNRVLYGPKSCDGIITTGSIVNQWVRELLGEQTSQLIKVIYYGDSLVRNGGSTEIPAELATLGISSESRVFCLLGRTQKVKGHLLLLDAITELVGSDIHLLFLVKDLEEFPEELEVIRNFIKQNHLESRVKILGFQKDLQAVLSVVDFGVIPSLASEVNCRVCVEFFSMGIPVISFPTGTLPDIVRHKKNGYLCKEKSASELISGINWVLNSHGDDSQIRKQALHDYETRYTLGKMAEETLKFYERCKK